MKEKLKVLMVYTGGLVVIMAMFGVLLITDGKTMSSEAKEGILAFFLTAWVLGSLFCLIVVDLNDFLVDK
jgi:hypothetical protein